VAHGLVPGHAPPCAIVPPVTAAVIVLSVLLVVAAGTAGYLGWELSRARTAMTELRETTTAERTSLRNPRAERAANVAGKAVRTVVETASRLREDGVRGTLISSLDDFTDWALEHRTDIARVADADGEVTIFFSDIENSTSMNYDLGDEQWVRLLKSHDKLLHASFDKHHGHVVKNQGDGYMVVFSTPASAVDCALDIQRALSAKRQRSRHLRRTPIRVRIGLHVGATIERDGDYFGSNVAMAARVAALADGGEILVTGEIAEALADRDDLRFTEEDTVELKGLPGEHQLWLVEGA
jgi:adenylate cyclase